MRYDMFRAELRFMCQNQRICEDNILMNTDRAGKME